KLFRCLAVAFCLPAFVAAQAGQSPKPNQTGSTPAAQPNQQPEPTPTPLKTTITVNDTLSAETPASITVLDQQQIQQIPGVDLDDRLRQVPGFSLFRRTSGVVANPTTQ